MRHLYSSGEPCFQDLIPDAVDSVDQPAAVVVAPGEVDAAQERALGGSAKLPALNSSGNEIHHNKNRDTVVVI